MKKIILAAAIMLLVGSFLTGCSADITEETDTVVEAITAGISPVPTETALPPVITSSVLLNDINTCYSLFPIAFADSNGDGLGDINGIRENLEYLKYDLGVDCIWLNPVHPSPSYHKYDVTDYYAIDPQLGTMEDYENLIAEMHELDMYLVMDFVVNHTSSEHPWFQAAKNNDEEYRDYYRWLTSDELAEYHTTSNWYSAGDSYYYAGFWSEMPELNLENEKVREELMNIADYWIEKGVDGFRIDAARHLYDNAEYPEGFDTLDANITFYNELSNHVKSVNENVFIISEIWMDFRSASAYYEGMDALFNFDIGELIVTAAYVGSNDIADTITYYMEQMDKYDNRVMGTFLSNHDQNRYIESLARSNSRAKVAVNLLFTLPGLPFIYYGEEIGMIGKKPDENIREPFVWGENSTYTTSWNLLSNNVNENTVSLEEQIADEDSLFNVYKNMIRIRKENPVLKSGGIAEVATGIKAVIAYTRFDDDNNLLIVHNTLDKEVSLQIGMNSEYSIIYAQDDENYINDGILYISGRSVIIIDLLENEDVTLDNPEVKQ